MLRNYLLIGFRNLRKHLGYSLINISGLAAGLCITLLLVAWIAEEVSYDDFHENAENIYRGSLEMNAGGQEMKSSVSPTALLPTLLEFPEVETGVRVYNPASRNPYIVRKGDNLFQEDDFYFADSTFFSVFSYQLVKGKKGKALTDPFSLILTESTSHKYFGNEDPIGKVVNINNTQDYVITGIVEDAPPNSFLQFDFIASFSSLKQSREQGQWWNANYQTFIVVNDKANLKEISRKTDEIVFKAIGADVKEKDLVHYNFMKLKDIHLHSTYASEFEPTGSIQYVYIFAAVAFLVLLIACINYVNLATARAIDRAKEVGVRKVIGAQRKELIVQFLGESVMITILSFLVAFFLAQVFIPLFNILTDKRIDPSFFYQPVVLLSSFLVLLIIAFVSGAYPALAITSFKPVQILKGKFRFSGEGIILRKILVITQFSISILLIVGTLVIIKQLNFLQEKKLGYDNSNVLLLPYDRNAAEAHNQLKQEFIRSGIVSNVGVATESPTTIHGGYGFSIEGQQAEETLIIKAVAADTGYIPTLNMQILAGRNFNAYDFEKVKKDTIYSFIINESMMKMLFLEKENVVGTRAKLSGRNGEIVGVVSDFHFSSLHQPIGPLVIFSQEDYNFMFAKLTTGDISDKLDKLKSIATRILPHRPFEYEFLDYQYKELYSNEQRMGNIFLVFAFLAIMIACLGLLGLVSFTTSQKTKEIGIRKVMGATPQSILFLITKDFGQLLLISIFIAIPVSYWLMSQWLTDFAYRTEIGIFPLLISSVIAIVIALGTAGYQALKAAWVDPAETLRSE